MNQGLRRAQGDVEEVGDLLIGEAVQMEHGERHTVLRRQPADSLQHGIRQLPLRNQLRRARREIGHLQHVQVHIAFQTVEQPGLECLHPVHGDAESHPSQPGREPLRLPKLTEVHVGPDERLLGDILCLDPVVHQAVGKPVDVALVPGHQVTVRIPVASQSVHNKLGIRRIRHPLLLLLTAIRQERPPIY